MPPSDLASRLGEIRQLTRDYKAGKEPDSFRAFCELLTLLLNSTVLKRGDFLKLERVKSGRGLYVISGHDGLSPLCLNNSAYLRLIISLQLYDTKDGPRVKVNESSFQYQIDDIGDQWIFRYDYLRRPTNPHPAAHLQIRANHFERQIGNTERIHFPTSRVSLEAIIRLLISEFGIKTNEPEEFWEPTLQESENLFLEIARQPEANRWWDGLFAKLKK